MNNPVITTHPAPELPQAKGDTINSTVIGKEGIKVRVPVYSGMAVGDQVTLEYAAYPNELSVYLQFSTEVTSVQVLELMLDSEVVKPDWKFLAVSYSVSGLESNPVIVNVLS